MTHIEQTEFDMSVVEVTVLRSALAMYSQWCHDRKSQAERSSEGPGEVSYWETEYNRAEQLIEMLKGLEFIEVRSAVFSPEEIHKILSDAGITCDEEGTITGWDDPPKSE